MESLTIKSSIIQLKSKQYFIDRQSNIILKKIGAEGLDYFIATQYPYGGYTITMNNGIEYTLEIHYISKSFDAFIDYDSGLLKITDATGKTYNINKKTKIDRICKECGAIILEGTAHRCKKIHRCKECGAIIPNTNKAGIKAHLCTTCAKKYSTEMLQYSYKPTPVFEKKNRIDNLHLGIELEIDRENRQCSITDDVSKLAEAINPDIYSRNAYFKPDSSLNYGIEIVTEPKTPEYYYKNKESISKIFELAKTLGYRSHDGGKCGLHLHIDRQYLGIDNKYQSSKIVYLVNTLWEQLQPLSRRTSSGLTYCKKLDIKKTDTDLEIDYKLNREDRYVLVNCQNSNTVELRFWRGALDVNSFLSAIDISEAIITTAKKYSLNKLQKIGFDTIYKNIKLQSTKQYILDIYKKTNTSLYNKLKDIKTKGDKTECV